MSYSIRAAKQVASLGVSIITATVREALRVQWMLHITWLQSFRHPSFKSHPSRAHDRGRHLLHPRRGPRNPKSASTSRPAIFSARVSVCLDVLLSSNRGRHVRIRLASSLTTSQTRFSTKILYESQRFGKLSIGKVIFGRHKICGQCAQPVDTHLVSVLLHGQSACRVVRWNREHLPLPCSDVCALETHIVDPLNPGSA